jgi:class 3 adenylate cyclase/predicted ATPase
MRCSGCGTESAGVVKFCNECGAAFNRTCPTCGAANSASAKFCGHCAAELASDKEAASGVTTTHFPLNLGLPIAEPVVEGERKLVTALFADIKGSVELMADLDAEDARAIIDPALRLMVDVVRAHEGYVVRSTGDGIYALFGAPIAYQDHPRRGVYAALAMQTALRSYSERLEQQNRRPITVRIGINTGEVVVRVIDTGARLEYGGIGHTINLAARLQTLASPGSVVIGDRTRKLVDGYFTLRALEPTVLKGMSDPVIAHEVEGISQLRRPLQIAMRRGLSQFVGRENELRLLTLAFEQMITGRGQIVATVTQAGTGKSRLLYEFLSTLPQSVRILDGYAMAHGKGMPWMPIVELLSNFFGIQPDDDAARRRSKIEAALAALDPALIEVTPYLFGLLGITDGPDALGQMDPRVRRTRLIDSVRDVILALSRNEPVVLVFEDLHWADAQTALLLDAVADSITDARVLLLVTYRPDHDPHWAGKDHYAEIRLQPLSADAAAALLESLLPPGGQLGPLKQSILEQTAGNPFFIEEISASLLEEGTVVQDGTTRLTKPLSQLRLPATVQDTLAERIDNLPLGHKELLQTLAVIGSRLPMELILAVCDGMKMRPDGILSDLRNADFIYLQPDSQAVVYVFKHAFTQEVAYNTLLGERRKRLHQRVAETMEVLYADTLRDHIGQLAYHYSRTSNVSRAIACLAQAGEVAVQRSAHAEAAETLNAALRLIERSPDGPERAAQESRLWLALGVSLQTSLGYAASEVGTAYQRALELAERTGDTRQLVAAIRGHSTYSIVKADYQTAFELGTRLSRIEVETQDHVAERLMIVGFASLYTGQFRLGEAYFLQAIAPEHANTNIETIHYSGHSRAASLSYLALNMWHLGYPDRALHYSSEAYAVATSLGIPITLAQAMGMCGAVRLARRDYPIVEQWMDKTIAHAVEQGFPYWFTFASLLKAELRFQRGEAAEALAMFEPHLQNYRLSGAKIGLPMFLAMRAHMLSECGRSAEALLTFDEAFALVEETNERYSEAELYRIKGEVLLKQDRVAAESLFLRSLTIAANQQAKSLELRAAISLAALWQSQGRTRAALDLLGPIHGWFTEGFDSPDLQRAQALLDELIVATRPIRSPQSSLS